MKNAAAHAIRNRKELIFFVAGVRVSAMRAIEVKAFASAPTGHGRNASAAADPPIPGWRDILSEVLGAECLYRMATDGGGEWRGVLPLVRVKSWIFGHYLVSLPFLNYGGPLGSPAARRRLVDDAVTEACHSQAELLELRSREDGDLDLSISSRKITVVLPLPPSPEELFQSFPSKLRSQIRRPMKEGLTVRFGLDQREPFYEVFARTMRDLGTPVLPLRPLTGGTATLGTAVLPLRPLTGETATLGPFLPLTLTVA